jgi:hypothetical protein
VKNESSNDKEEQQDKAKKQEEKQIRKMKNTIIYVRHIFG